MSSFKAATTLAVASGVQASLFQSCNDANSASESKCAEYFQKVFDASNIEGCHSFDSGKCGILASAANIDWIVNDWDSTTDFVGTHPQSSGEPVKQNTNKWCDNQLGTTGQNDGLAYASMSFLNKEFAKAAVTEGKSTILTFSDSGDNLKNKGFAYLINHEVAGKSNGFEIPAFVARDAQSNWRCYQMGLSASLLTTKGRPEQEKGFKYVKYADIMCPTCGEDCADFHFDYNLMISSDAKSDPHYSSQVTIDGAPDSTNDFTCQSVIASSGTFEAAFETDSNPEKSCYKTEWKEGQSNSCTPVHEGRFLTAEGKVEECDSCFNSLCSWKADKEGETVTGNTLNQGVQLSHQLLKNLCNGRTLDDCVNQFLYTEIFSKYSDNYSDHNKGWDNNIAALAIKSDMWTEAGNGDQKAKDYICAITKHRDEIQNHISKTAGKSGYVIPLVVFDFQGTDKGEVFSANDVEATAKSYCGGSDGWTKYAELNCYHKAEIQLGITGVDACKTACLNDSKCKYITMLNDGTECYFNENQDHYCTGPACCDDFTENPSDPTKIAITMTQFDTYIPGKDWFKTCAEDKEDFQCSTKAGQCDSTANHFEVKVNCRKTCHSWCSSSGTQTTASNHQNSTNSVAINREQSRREASRSATRSASRARSHRSARRQNARTHSSRQRNSRRSSHSRHSRRSERHARSAHRQQRRSERSH